MVLCAIALSLAYPVREYIAQRRQIDQLEAQRQAIAIKLGRLEQQQKLLSSNAYVEQQAQDKLHMCPPAEKCYVIINRPPPPGKAAAGHATRHALVRAGVEFGPAGGQGPGPVTASVHGAIHGGRRPEPSAAEAAAVARQLGREPRALLAVAHRCPCGLPDVVETAPAAARRHPVPDAVLPDLPARGRRGEPPGGRRADAGDDAADRGRSRRCGRPT